MLRTSERENNTLLNAGCQPLTRLRAYLHISSPIRAGRKAKNAAAPGIIPLSAPARPRAARRGDAKFFEKVRARSNPFPRKRQAAGGEATGEAGATSYEGFLKEVCARGSHVMIATMFATNDNPHAQSREVNN